jgi:hypothetical protein
MGIASMAINAFKETLVMKTYGNIILMAAICIVIFWVFMALRPADAARIRCGSSWEICAQRGKGPHLKYQNDLSGRTRPPCNTRYCATGGLYR